MKLPSSGVLCFAIAIVCGAASSARADVDLNGGGFAHVYSAQGTSCSTLGFTIDVNEVKSSGNAIPMPERQVMVLSVGYWDWCNDKWWSGETVVTLAKGAFSSNADNAWLTTVVPVALTSSDPNLKSTTMEVALKWTGDASTRELINRIDHRNMSDGSTMAVRVIGHRERATVGGTVRIGGSSIPIPVVFAEVGALDENIVRVDKMPGTKEN